MHGHTKMQAQTHIIRKENTLWITRVVSVIIKDVY